MGKLIILSAPSGAGKTTICKHLLGLNLKLEFSISACSRTKRVGERHGSDYYFLPVNEFKKKIENGEFLEWEEVYADMYYGTLISEIERIWQKGNHVIFDVDVVGGLNIKKHYGEKALAIFVMPPSVEELKLRLKTRSTDSDEEIDRRIAKAEKEMSYSDKFDKVIVNRNLQDALNEASRIVMDFVNQSHIRSR